MGILADFFVATPADAARYEALMHDEDPLFDTLYERAEYKGFTGLELGTLWAILEGVPWNVERHMLETLIVEEDSDTWLEAFQDELVDLLVAMDDSTKADAAERWGATDELDRAGAELLPVLDDLQRLARSARRDGKGLFLWGSL